VSASRAGEAVSASGAASATLARSAWAINARPP
jgi:hypothetical protein